MLQVCKHIWAMMSADLRGPGGATELEGPFRSHARLCQRILCICK